MGPSASHQRAPVSTLPTASASSHTLPRNASPFSSEEAASVPRGCTPSVHPIGAPVFSTERGSKRSRHASPRPSIVARFRLNLV